MKKSHQTLQDFFSMIWLKKGGRTKEAEAEGKEPDTGSSSTPPDDNDTANDEKDKIETDAINIEDTESVRKEETSFRLN